MTLATATISRLSATVTPAWTATVRIRVAATISPELTILLAAMVRAVSALGTVVVRKA